MTLEKNLEIEKLRFHQKFKGRERSILLVGGGGYIGLVVAQYLLNLNQKVIILDNFIYSHEKYVASLSNSQNLIVKEFDIRNDLGDFVTDHAITDVVILGGLVGDPITRKYPELSKSINGNAIKSLYKSLNNKGLNKVIFISTCSNYGLIDDDKFADEDFELCPLSPYAREKVENEQFILSSINDVDFSPTILRFATAFGLSPRMRYDLTLNEFTLILSRNEVLEVYDPDTWRPYCHVQDFARLIHRTIFINRELTNGEIFNAGGDNNNHTKRSIIEIITKHIKDCNVKYVSGGKDARNYKVDFSKVREKLYFEPEWSADDGVEEILKNTDGQTQDLELGKSSLYGNYSIESKYL